MRRFVTYASVLLIVSTLSAGLIYSLVSQYMLARAEAHVADLLLSQRSLHLYIQRVMHPEFYHACAQGQIEPNYYAPQILSSSFIVRNMHVFYNEERQKRGLPPIYYKMAAENPRNPLNQADQRETGLLHYFNAHREVKEHREVVEIDGQHFLAYALPFLETKPACLRCHGRREDAPAGVQALYPGPGGFDDQVGNIRAIESIRVPVTEEMVGAYVVTGSLSAGVMSIALLFGLNYGLRSRVRARTEQLQGEVAERMRAEEELRCANEELAEAVDLAEASAVEAHQANRVKSEFLANMSHEIRTPMNGLLGMLQLLEGTSLDRDQASYVEVATTCGWNLTQLLSDILDLSVIEAGKLTLHQAPVDLRAMVSKSLAIFDPQLRSKALSLSVELATELPQTVVSDETRLRQILFNLVGNAIKFTEQGQITVRLRCAAPAAEHTMSLQLEVADTGVGIPAALLAKIFEPFTQGDLSCQKRYQGAGLGLAIVQRLAVQMGGAVTIASTVGQGTTIRVALPLVVPVGSTAVAAHATALNPTAPLRILLVEDNLTNQQAKRCLLERLGYLMYVADTGQAALAVLAREEIDLVLLDIQLPGMVGLETLQRIRAGENGVLNPRVPVVAVAAYAMQEDREAFLAAGMDGYLAKPVRSEALRQLIKQLTDTKRLPA